MDTLWVFAVILGVVAGDVGLGYHYKVPQTSYGVPTYHSSTSGTGYNSAINIGSDGTYKHYPSTVTYPTIGQSTFGQSNIGQSSIGQSAFGQSTFGQSSVGQSGGDLNSIFGQNTGYVSGLPSTVSATSTVGEAAASNSGNYYQNSYIQPADYSAFNQYQTSSAQKYQQYYNVIQQQPAQVFKHFYVHAAPEEPEVPKASQQIVLPPPQKHYKIIFIKAPTTPAQAPQIIPVPSQKEEKTLVYVLVKKPEEAQNIVLPKIEEKAPTKPEVFFIKYNNKQDSQAVIENIVSDINKGANLDASYSAVAASNLGSASSGKVIGHDVGLSESQGASSVYDSSSSVGSTSFNSGSSSSSSVGTGSSASSSFDSNLSDSSSSSGSSFNSQNNFGLYDGVGISNSGISNGAYDGSSVSSVSTTASTIGGYDASAISTSQGIPHETYGPPKFKVL